MIGKALKDHDIVCGLGSGGEVDRLNATDTADANR